jgi:hypothetical protein
MPLRRVGLGLPGGTASRIFWGRCVETHVVGRFSTLHAVTHNACIAAYMMRHRTSIRLATFGRSCTVSKGSAEYGWAVDYGRRARLPPAPPRTIIWPTMAAVQQLHGRFGLRQTDDGRLCHAAGGQIRLRRSRVAVLTYLVSDGVNGLLCPLKEGARIRTEPPRPKTGSQRVQAYRQLGCSPRPSRRSKGSAGAVHVTG